MLSSVSFVCLFFSCLGILHTIQGQILFTGTCPDVPVIADFDVPAYMGLWYEIAKYPTVFEVGGKCITANYTLTANGTVDVVNSQYSTVTQGQVEIKGTAVAVENGKLLVQFPGAPAANGSNYWVLDTDYKSYSVVFSCTQTTSKTYSQTIWILSRTRVPSIETFLTAVMAIDNNNLNLNYLKVTDQEGCSSCSC